MSALAEVVPHIRAMTEDDLWQVMGIETAIYSHPWTRGNFLDSVKAGYTCQVMEVAGEIVGYGVMMIAAGEAHLLNLSIAADWQRRGLGTALLGFMDKMARDSGAATMYLEVRVSNAAGRGLYGRKGFSEIGQRRDYYPCADGREDAISMERKLS